MLIPFSSLSRLVPRLQLRRISIKALLLFKSAFEREEESQRKVLRESSVKFMFTSMILPQGFVT